MSKRNIRRKFLCLQNRKTKLQTKTWKLASTTTHGKNWLFLEFSFPVLQTQKFWQKCVLFSQFFFFVLIWLSVVLCPLIWIKCWLQCFTMLWFLDYLKKFKLQIIIGKTDVFSKKNCDGNADNRYKKKFELEAAKFMMLDIVLLSYFLWFQNKYIRDLFVLKEVGEIFKVSDAAHNCLVMRETPVVVLQYMLPVNYMVNIILLRIQNENKQHIRSSKCGWVSCWTRIDRISVCADE